MLPEVLENDDFPKVSFVRRLVNISGTVRAIDLKFCTGKRYGSTAYAYGYIVSLPLLWWHKLKLNKYLRNQVSD
jgi:hypothetical protein